MLRAGRKANMKVVSITDVRQDATNLVEHAQKTHEPVLVCVRSRPVAYIVEAEAYEALQRDLKQLRHELFWQDVRAAESEHRAGQSQEYKNADALITDLQLEP
jgi:prevent-host-death family protein